MMKRLNVAGGLVVLAVGCGSGAPTAPSPFPGNTTASPPASGSVPPPTYVPPTISSPGPTLIPGRPIQAGTTVEVIVESSNATCFQNWDASGRCSQYDFTAPADGTLRAVLQVPGLSRGVYNPELFLVTAGGAWEYVGSHWPELEGSLAVKGGMLYRIVIISYGPFPDTLTLSVELR